MDTRKTLMPTGDSKTCTRCGVEKPLDEYYFEKGRPRGRCKTCHRAILDARDPEHVRAVDAKSRAKHREKIRERNREGYKKNGERYNENRRAKRAEDPEPSRAQQRASWGAQQRQDQRSTPGGMG